MPARTYLLAEIAERLGGEVVDGEGIHVSAMATLANAGPQHLSFFTDGRLRAQLGSTRAGAVIVSRRERESTHRPRIVCDDPYAYYARAVALLHPEAPAASGVHPSAVIEEGALVPASASVGPHCFVGRDAVLGERVVLGPGCVVSAEVRIGADSRLVARVSVYERSVLGCRAIVHAGAVIGADGFGMAREGEGWRKIPQVGRVLIGDDVEIGANTTIDRGALDDTVIEDGVKLDNQIQVGHNVRIGAHSALAGCVGIAGSARIGRRCTIGGGAIVLGHLEIADDVHISAASVVTRSIRQAGHYAGLYPLQPKGEWARGAVLLRNLEKLEHRLGRLERGQADRGDDIEE